MKTRPVGVDLFHVDGRADGRTDGRRVLTKITITFRNSAKAPKKVHAFLHLSEVLFVNFLEQNLFRRKGVQKHVNT
jgi:hypothetical protein